MKLSNKISTSFLIFNIIFIIFSLFYIEFRNSSELDSHCLENIYSDEIENILKRGESYYYKISLFPDHENFKCMGVQFESPKEFSNVSNFYITSPKFFSFLFFFFNLLIPFVFIFFEKNNKIIYQVLIVVNNIALQILFFNNFYLDGFTFVIVYAVVFITLLPERVSPRYLISFLYLNGLLLMYNYTIFSNLLLILFTMFVLYFRKLQFGILEKKLLNWTVINYFFAKLLSGIFDIFDDFWITSSFYTYSNLDKYADLSYFFSVINCTAGENCVGINNYGPILEFTKFNVDVDLLTKIIGSISVIVVVVIFIQLNQNMEVNNFYLFYLFISPPVIFALNRMNMDLHMSILAFLALAIHKKNKVLSYLLLSLITQFKIYPIFLIFGIFLFFIICSRKKDAIFALIFLATNSLILIYYYFSVNFVERIQNQSKIEISFGLLSTVQNLNLYFNIGFVSSVIILGLILIFFYKIIKKSQSKSDSNRIGFEEFSLSIFILLISVFPNFDFRILPLVVLTVFMINKKTLKEMELNIFLVFLLTCASNMHKEYLEYQYSIYKYLFSTTQVLVNEIFFLLSTVVLFNFLKTFVNSKNNSLIQKN